jgi:small-conductance mechanosensitive channel
MQFSMAAMVLRRFGLLRVTAGFLAVLLISTCAGLAQTETPPVPDQQKIDQFVALLSDPAVKDWLARQVATSSSVAAPAEDPVASDGMQQSMVSSSLDRIRNHVAGIAQAWPLLPQKFERVRDFMMAEFADRGRFYIAGIVLLFVGVGTGLSYIAIRLSRPLRLWTIALPRNTPQGRMRKFGGRALLGLLLVGSFILGSAGAFLMFEWPPLLREIVLSYLTAAIAIWTVRVIARITLLPSSLQVEGARQVRAFNISDGRADHWYRWIVVITSIFSLIAASFTLLPTFGFQFFDVLALAVPADLILLAALLAAVWLRPATDPQDGERAGSLGHNAVSWLMTVYFILLFVIRTSGAFVLFWFAVAAFALPAAIVMTNRAVAYILRPPEEDVDAPPVPAVTVAVVDRAIRLVLIVFAAFLLARVWGLDMASMETTNPTTTLVLRGLLNAVVIALAADFGWSIIKAVIERKLGVDAPMPLGEEEGAHLLDPQQARLRTLLPIVQNIMFAVILIMAVLMILSSIGIQIGPLIAGAGVVGVAVGFGAQTVVKDVISGVFYLLDDAFRVGEYISSGKYMGTVESFSLRSIKLRHHRGPLFTIPFGELGAVQNQSRDWVTDKFNITVGFDTDLEFARKLIKRIGLALAEDPEFKPWVIEPIKMQGVQEFGEYGIVIRMKMTLRPGGAFQMKRKFYVQVRQVFKEQGIKLPGPSVQVQQDEAAIAALAAAQAHTTRRKKQAAAKAAEEAG